jgi:hypothetical protein
MRQILALAAACLALAASTATAAEIAPAPLDPYPSGTTTLSLTAYSDGGSGEYGWVAYKLPHDTGWHRCNQGPVPLSVTGLGNGGTYTVLVADDLNKNWLAANGLLYSGLAAQCSTTSEPSMPPTSYTFTVASPPQPPPTPTTTSPTPTTPTATPVMPTVPPTTGSSTSNHDGCALLKVKIRRARAVQSKAAKTYHKSPTKGHKKALAKAKRKLAQLTASYLAKC